MLIYAFSGYSYLISRSKPSKYMTLVDISSSRQCKYMPVVDICRVQDDANIRLL